MVDSLHGKLYFCILAEGMARIEVPVPLGEIATGNLNTNPMPDLEHVAGSSQADRVFVNLARLDGLHYQT